MSVFCAEIRSFRLRAANPCVFRIFFVRDLWPELSVRGVRPVRSLAPPRQASVSFVFQFLEVRTACSDGFIYMLSFQPAVRRPFIINSTRKRGGNRGGTPARNIIDVKIENLGPTLSAVRNFVPGAGFVPVRIRCGKDIRGGRSANKKVSLNVESAMGSPPSDSGTEHCQESCKKNSIVRVCKDRHYNLIFC